MREKFIVSHLSNILLNILLPLALILWKIVHIIRLVVTICPPTKGNQVLPFTHVHQIDSIFCRWVVPFLFVSIIDHHSSIVVDIIRYVFIESREIFCVPWIFNAIYHSWLELWVFIFCVSKRPELLGKFITVFVIFSWVVMPCIFYIELIRIGTSGQKIHFIDLVMLMRV